MPDSRYVGYGLYIGHWQPHQGEEGNLKREDTDLVAGPSTQFATASDPSVFVGTFATYPEIEAQAN